MDPDQLDRGGHPLGLPVDPKVMQPKEPSQQHPGLLLAGHDNSAGCGGDVLAHGP